MIRCFIIMIFINVLFVQRSIGQEDSLSYIVLNADTMDYSQVDGHERDSLTGNVVMIQDSLFMTCLRAVVVDELYVDAYDDVVILHDGSEIFSDSMFYDGVEKIADLYGRVVLQEGGRSVFTDALKYDIDTKQAEYKHGGTIIEGDRRIVSRVGFYDTEVHLAILSRNVHYQDSSMTMITDSVLYYSDIEQLIIVKPTQISQDSIDIYCESGIYRLQNKQGILSTNVQVKTQNETITSGILAIDGNKEIYTFWINPVAIVSDGVAEADTIIYYKKEEMVDLIGHAVYKGSDDQVAAPFIRYFLETEEYQTEGRANIESGTTQIKANEISSREDGASILSGVVNIKDVADGTTIRSDHAIMKDSIMKVYSDHVQAEMDYAMAEDTLFLRADTLKSIESFQDTDSSQQVYHAIDDVSLITGDVSGRSGYFKYNKRDSVIIMTEDPVLWSDSVQLSADTILIYLSDNRVSRIEQIGNAFILSPDDKGNLNQIKCKVVNNIVTDGKIDTTFAMKNVEMCYLVIQDDEYEAVNLTKASAMEFTFDKAEIKTVKMSGSQESNMYEYKEGMDVTQYYLSDYKWRITERPTKEVQIGPRFLLDQVDNK